MKTWTFYFSLLIVSLEPRHFLGHEVLGLAPLNLIVWYYVLYYVWHDVWLNIVINKVVLLLSEIMVTWIFGHYHIVHEMYSMWFMWKVTEDINHKFFVNSKFRFVVGDEIGHFICEDYNISTKKIFLDHGNGDF